MEKKPSEEEAGREIARALSQAFRDYDFKFGVSVKRNWGQYCEQITPTGDKPDAIFNLDEEDTAVRIWTSVRQPEVPVTYGKQSK